MADEDPNAKSSRGLIKYGLFGVGGLLLIVIGLAAFVASNSSWSKSVGSTLQNEKRHAFVRSV